MIGDEEWHRGKYVQFVVDSFQVTASVHEQAVVIELFSILNANTFNIIITQKSLDENNALSFLFEKPMEVYEFIVKNQKIIRVSKEGVLMADLLIMEKLKTIKIQTEKFHVGDKQLLQKTLKMLQEAYKIIDQLKEKYGINQKNAERPQKKVEKFQVDTSGEHFKCYEQIGNKIKRISHDRVYKNIFGKQLTAKSIFSFKVLQTKTLGYQGDEGYQALYGVASNRIRDKDDSYNQVGDSALYYSYGNGRLYPGRTKLNSSGVQDGQVIETVINTINWTVIWNKNGSQLAAMVIPEQMRNEKLFPVIILYYVDSEIELVY